MRELEFITGHVTYNPAYTYKFQLKPLKRKWTTLKHRKRHWKKCILNIIWEKKNWWTHFAIFRCSSNKITKTWIQIFLHYIKFMFSKKATKIDDIFTVDLTSCSKCQIDGEDFVNTCCFLRKYELYLSWFFHKY